MDRLGLAAERPQAPLSLGAVPCPQHIHGRSLRGPWCHRGLLGVPAGASALRPCFWVLLAGDVLPSPNVGLPSALIPREPPGPAYVTHTGPLVRRLRQQEGPGRAAPDPHPHPAPERPHAEPGPHAEPEPRSEPRPRSQPGPSPRPEHPPVAPGHRRAPAPPGLCHMILFARNPLCSALPPSSPACPCHRQ